MLYEMICVRVKGARNTDEVKELARTAGSLILAHGGVVRGLTNWGRFLLTKAVKKNQARHGSGHHFILRFDASPSVQELARKTIAIDPRMIRCGVVKMGGKLKDIADVKGVVEWQRKRRASDLGSYMDSL
ncbi:37S ribosomal protein Mrp17 [Usnea florida]